MLHGISPDELTEKILNGVKAQMEQFKKEIGTTEKTEFLTRQETATFLKISLFCLHDWIKKGVLKPYKMGNRTYFERKEIENKLFNSNNL
jgi:hypothetical protein